MTTRTQATMRRLAIARRLRGMELPDQRAVGHDGSAPDYDGYMLMCGRLAEAFGVRFAPYEWTLEELRDAIVVTLEAGEVTASPFPQFASAITAIPASQSNR